MKEEVINGNESSLYNYIVDKELYINGLSNVVVLTDGEPLVSKVCDTLKINGNFNFIYNVYVRKPIKVKINGSGNEIKGKTYQELNVKNNGLNNNVVYESNIKLFYLINEDLKRILKQRLLVDMKGVSYQAIAKMQEKYNIIEKEPNYANNYYILGWIMKQKTNKCDLNGLLALLYELYKNMNYTFGNLQEALSIYESLNENEKLKFHYALSSTFYACIKGE